MREISQAEDKSIRGALLRYRVMAYTVGTLLIMLVFVAMPLKYLWHRPMMTTVLGITHGWLYMALIITAYDLSRRVRWPLMQLGKIALAGTIPFLSFVAEYYARHHVLRTLAGGRLPD